LNRHQTPLGGSLARDQRTFPENTFPAVLGLKAKGATAGGSIPTVQLPKKTLRTFFKKMLFKQPVLLALALENFGTGQGALQAFSALFV
jgi:hypothetical protein